jgi:hypothetical protein
MRKGVVSPISLVLIVAIVLALIALAYVWGLPLIEKRVSMVNYGAAENFMERIDEAITNVVNKGGGKEEISLPFGGLRAIPNATEDPDNNSIIFEFVMPQPLAIDRSTIYIGTTSFMDMDKEVGVYGQSKPGVLSLTTERYIEDYRYRMKLHYRELETVSAPEKGYIIALRSSKSSGSNSVIISFGQTEVLPGKAANGGDLTVTHIDVDVY